MPRTAKGPARRPAEQRKTSTEVAFDLRRNLINVLGEEHYPYAEFLYHELAANAYDEDASEVQIVEEILQPAGPGRPALYNITIRDDGNGMDLDGLRQYFTVGESEKPERRESERLKRPLIGRIGVGKVSILKVARQWTIETERHLGRAKPVRLRVHVDVDDWIDGRIHAFPVESVKPTGKRGTAIVLEGVHARLREDRILRHLQRLPLGDSFMVWRNGEPIPPRRWYGIHKIDVNETVTWEENGSIKRERIRGEIWIRPYLKNKREQAFIMEPASESDGVNREPAGIEVRVNQDMIVREFFGHDSHGHQVNRIWGWVEADWLPILGNRTDYLRDSPAGHAFSETMKPLFLKAYNTVRYEQDRRAKDKKVGSEAKGKPALSETSQDQTAATGHIDETLESLASRYGKGLNEVLEEKPEFAPVVDAAPKTSRGQPAKDRIYPVRPTGDVEYFEEHDAGTDLAVVEEEELSRIKRATTGSALRKKSRTSHRRPLATVLRNTRAGVKLRFAALGLEGPYKWDIEDPEDLALAINTDHALYRLLSQDFRPGSVPHRLLCSWLVALALSERSHPVTGPGMAADLETVSYELYSKWMPRK